MEYGSIEREIHVEATPEVAYEVVSSPEHLREWWPDDADLDPTPGATGEIIFGERGSEDANVEQITVVEADPPRRFSFRWTHAAGEVATETNSLLVTFDLVPAGNGTVVRMKETGFREMGWEVAVLEEQYAAHVEGWDFFIPRLGTYVTRLVESS
ncbi:SRPBCC domain-containing protein [Luteipulveratus mongoliensis]|uniref:Polyketide cyclase n=1 Tax=Luteipulveratus mongoliensis TaxID=571913 RepID=A0A0K1JNH6_9MICO|nr:SRPBCC domain-containing protein [Luteipulveratus mongoliensis]AKU18251.1 polyketide cyclase [Luteipulveratus mongoliensis]